MYQLELQVRGLRWSQLTIREDEHQGPVTSADVKTRPKIYTCIVSTAMLVKVVTKHTIKQSYQ